MKKLLLLAASIPLAAVSVSAQLSSNNNGTTSPPKTAPTVGMSRDQARAYYGEPFTRSSVKNGERWYYRLKFDEVYGRAFVPFYYDSPNVRWGSIDFGPDGRVRGYDWQRPALR